MKQIEGDEWREGDGEGEVWGGRWQTLIEAIAVTKVSVPREEYLGIELCSVRERDTETQRERDRDRETGREECRKVREQDGEIQRDTLE